MYPKKEKPILAILLTALLTSLFWLFLYFVIMPSVKGTNRQADTSVQQVETQSAPEDASKPRYEVNAKKDVDYSQLIVGHWEPIEVSAFKLDFSEFGTLKTHTHKHGYPITTDYKYKLLGDRMGYTAMADFYEGDWHRIEISVGEDGKTYLSIFDDPELGGRYCKTLSTKK